MNLKIDIDDALAHNVEKKARELGFSSLDGYVLHLLKKETKEMESEEEQIARKLEELGYM